MREKSCTGLGISADWEEGGGLFHQLKVKSSKFNLFQATVSVGMTPLGVVCKLKATVDNTRCVFDLYCEQPSSRSDSSDTVWYGISNGTGAGQTG